MLIRERRKELQLDQQELARRAGVSRQWIIDLERGKAGIGLGLVLRTLQVLGLALDVAPERVARGKAAKTDQPASELDELIKRLESFPAQKGKRG